MNKEFWIKFEDSEEGGYWKVFGPGVWLSSCPSRLKEFTRVREVPYQEYEICPECNGNADHSSCPTCENRRVVEKK